MPYIITFIICISGLVYIGIKEERRRRNLVSEKQRDYNICNEELMQSLMQPPLKLYDINKSNLEENKVKIVGFVKKISYIHTRSIYKTIGVAHIDYYDYKSCKIKNETVLLTEYEKSNGALREGSLVYILAIECRKKIKFQYLLNEYCSTPWNSAIC